MKKNKLVLVTVAAFACAGNALAENVIYVDGGTANYGPETHIEKTGSGQRILVYQGTANINEGAYVKCGGDGAGSCNFVGIDKTKAAAMNINGGTVWCTKSGGGAGILAVGNKDNGVTSTLTLNSGTLIVEGSMRSSTAYNSLAGGKSSGTITINGGEATVGTFYLGSSSASSGTSTLVLNGGKLTVNEMNFQRYNGQVFTWQTAMLAAARANIFVVNEYTSANNKTRTMQITGAPASFDTAGYAQSIPAFTGTGRLRLTGGGVVTFEQASLTYGLIFDGITVNLGTLDAGAARITTTLLEIMGPATLNVTLPESPSGRYPLIACTSTFDGSIGQITVSGGGAGVLVRDGNTLYLSFDPADAGIGLVYSAAAGGADTPAETSYTRLAFTDTAGAFTVGGSGLTLSQDIADESASAQTVTAPVTLSTANSSIYVAEGGRLTLSGGLTATTPRKDGPGTLVLNSATMPSEIMPRKGVLDLGGNTLSGKLTFTLRRYNGEEIVITNGTWRPSAQCDFRTQGQTITIADGFTVDLTANANSRVLIGNLNVHDEWQETRVIIDGGTVKTLGDKSNVCNFIGVDHRGRSFLEVRRGLFQTTGSNRGTVRIAAGTTANVNGTVRVSGGTFMVENDLSMGTVFNGLTGGAGNGAFELSGGFADVGNFYIGATSSSAGRSAATLTGGVLEVGVLKCLAYNKQTLLADGATIRAKRNDTAAAPFMTAVASADSYAKSYTIGAGGLTIDTAGHNVHCDIPWTGEGGLTVTGGGGSLALCAPPAFTGDVVISNTTSLVLTNSATFAGKIAFLGADSKIRIDTTSYQEDSLTVATDGFTLPSGVTDVLDLVELVGDGFVASVSADGKSIELGLAANVAAFAWWTGGGDPADLDDPDNWACTNSTGGVVANALPVKSTVVVLSGTTTFAVPAGTTPVWVTTQIGGGNGGAVTLGADCDWSAAPNLTIADGSYLDLCGHNLKISYLTAAEDYDGAYVTNSVAGTKPALWAENKFSETTYIDTTNVRVCTDCVEVKSVNYGTFTTAEENQAMTLDAAVIVTNGAMTVPGTTHIGGNNHSAVICVSNNASATFTGVRLGHYDASNGRIIVADNATFRLGDFINVGNHNSGESVFTQDGGTVTVSADFNVGVGNSGTAHYEISGGTMTGGNNFRIGLRETTPGNGAFTQRGGTVTALKGCNVGQGAGTVGSYNMIGGVFNSNSALVPGRESGTGTFTQSGGTVNAKHFLTIGYVNANGSYAITGGEVFVTNGTSYVIVGQESGSRGVFDIAGGNVTARRVSVAVNNATGTLRVRNGGRLVLTAAGIDAGNGVPALEFDGGSVVATADNAAFIDGFTNMVFGASGVTLDTAGYNLGVTNCTMYATPGARAITLTGGGTLDFTNTTLDFTAPLTRGFVLAQVAADDAATFANAPALAPGVKGYKVKLSADGKTIKVVSKGLIIIVK